MCDCYGLSSFAQCRSGYHNHDLCPAPQQRQSVEAPCNNNHATTSTQTQTQSCSHHTQTQSQSLIRTILPACRTLSHDPNTFYRPSPTLSPFSYQQNNHNNTHRRNLETLLRDVLNYTICNTDTITDCAACHALCHNPSQIQREPQQCNSCNADNQQLVTVLLNLIERMNSNTWNHNHNVRSQQACRLHDLNVNVNINNNNNNMTRYQRGRCDCQVQMQTHCTTCITTHEQTKTLIDVLYRITRRRGRGRSYTRTSIRCQRCTHSHSHSRSCSPPHTHRPDNDMLRVIRNLLDEIEGGSSIKCCRENSMVECREYLDGNVRRLRKLMREIEGEIGGFDDDGGCGCGNGNGGGRGVGGSEDFVQVSRVTMYNEPERRRPRVGNLSLGWVL